MTHHADLFTPRQLTALTTFSDLVGEAHERVLVDARSDGFKDGAGLDRGGTSADAYADSVAVFLALAGSRTTNKSAAVCGWDSSPKMEAIRGVFARQALSMVWDFAEANVFGGSSGDMTEDLDWVGRVVSRVTPRRPGNATQVSARARD